MDTGTTDKESEASWYRDIHVIIQKRQGTERYAQVESLLCDMDTDTTDKESETSWYRDLWYGVASSSRLLKILGLFCKRAL